MTVLALAQRTGPARGTVQARLERFRTSPALRLHSTRVSPAALGYGLAASVAVEPDQHQLEASITCGPSRR